jgi:23S rRNA (uracil1939-C5)-methyltransferase
VSLEGRVRGLAREDSVVETERGLVFVAGGLPGERVRLDDVRKDGKVLRARRMTVLEASPERIEPACAHAARCGGCPLMHASVSAQSAAKRSMIERALARVPRIAAELSVPLVIPEARLGYRRRARLAWSRSAGGGVRLGFRIRRGERIVDIDRCVVLRPELERALALIREQLAPLLPGSGEIHLAIGAAGLPVIGIETGGAPPRELYARLEAMVAGGSIAGAAVQAGGASVAAFTVGDPSEASIDFEGRSLRGAALGFSQAHEEINARLAARAIGLAEAEGARVLELHAGHGNLTLALAARAAHLRAVEISEGATAALRRNLDAHQLRAEVITADAAAAIPKKGIDVVVLDPPRIGAKDAIGGLLALRPDRIVYVSCDPATLARDLETLGRGGYVLDAAEGFDMFPQTAHVETVARMRPR